MNNLLDTVLNINVFLFLGLLLWLYFKPIKSDDDDTQ